MSKTDPFLSALEAALPALFRYSCAVTGSRSEGENLLHDALVRALERRDQYRGGDLKIWLIKIIQSSWKNELSKRSSHRRMMDNLIEPEAWQTNSNVDDRLILRDVDRSMARLSSECRQIAMLIFAFGYTYREVSNLLDMPLNTVLSHAYRIRKHVKASSSDDEARDNCVIAGK